MELLGAAEKEAFCALVKAMLRYFPDERILAREVLASEWIQKRAIPELEKVRGGGEEEVNEKGGMLFGKGETGKDVNDSPA